MKKPGVFAPGFSNETFFKRYRFSDRVQNAR